MSDTSTVNVTDGRPGGRWVRRGRARRRWVPPLTQHVDPDLQARAARDAGPGAGRSDEGRVGGERRSHAAVVRSGAVADGGKKATGLRRGAGRRRWVTSAGRT